MKTITIPPVIQEGASALHFRDFIVEILEGDDRFNFDGYAGFKSASRIEAKFAEALDGDKVELEDEDHKRLAEAVRSPKRGSQPWTWPLPFKRRILLPFADAILSAE